MNARRSTRLFLLALLTACSMCVAAPAMSAVDRWAKVVLPADTLHLGSRDSSAFMNGTGVNLTIMPLDSAGTASRSMVLWYADDEDEETNIPGQVHSGAWLWTAPTDSIPNAGVWPENSFKKYGAIDFGFRVFCSGMAPMLGGNTLITGGTTELEDGSDTCGVFDRFTRQTTRSKMRFPRWYADAIRLPQASRVLITSGSRFKEIRLLGGNAANSDSVFRCPLGHVSAWDAPVRPHADVQSGGRPDSMVGQTGVFGFGSEIYFGGKNISTGEYHGGLWQLYTNDNKTGADYDYQWLLRGTTSSSFDQPSARAFQCSASFYGDDTHFGSSVNSGTECLVVYGGVGNGGAEASIHWCYLDQTTFRLVWRKILTQSGTPPGSRYGHIGYWDQGYNRLLVFGGGGTDNLPHDNAVYSMTFNSPTSLTWTKLTTTGVGPSPRMSMASDLILPAGAPYRRIAIFGGRTSASALSDSLYVLEILDANNVKWYRVAHLPNAPWPGVRELAAGTTPTNSQELWVSGGKNASGVALDSTWSVNVAGRLDSLAWERRASSPRPVYGHTFRYLDSDVFVRTPEVFDASTATTTYTLVKDGTGSNLNLLQDWYPQMFLLPSYAGGPTSKWRVFCAGPDVTPYVLAIDTTASPNGTWTATPAARPTGCPASFRGGSTVMYRPGQFLTCGGRDSDPGTLHSAAVGTAITTDLRTATPSATLLQSLAFPRVDHNLTILADGKVLVTGGLSNYNNDSTANAVRTPEIWDPDTQAWTHDLSPNPVWRGYHSSVVLLLDGRCLSTGGNATDDKKYSGSGYFLHQWYADLYSPPYLFNSNGTPATRPVLKSVARVMDFKKPQSVSFMGASTVIARMALIAPGAATHGFDESQRYIPLSFTAQGDSVQVTGEKRLHVTGPLDSTFAPPGEYMLFAVDGAGVPCVANWVTVGTIPPQKITDLAADCILPSPCSVKWTAPSASWNDATSGAVGAYELWARDGTAVDTTSLTSATLISTGTPASPGALEYALVTWVNDSQGVPQNVTAGHRYYFRIRSRDVNGHLSPWSASANFTVRTNIDCQGSLAGGGGGGGGARAQRASIIGQQASRVPTGNTMLDGDPDLQPSVDAMVMGAAPSLVDGHARIWLAQTGGMTTHVSQARLIAVDHPISSAVVPVDSGIVAGSRVRARAWTITHEDGTIDALDPARPVTANAGDTLQVDLSEGGDAAGSVIALTGSSSYDFWGEDSSGVLVQVPAGANGWRTITRRGLRHHAADVGVRNPGSRVFRLVFLSTCTLDWIGHVEPTTGGTTVTRYMPVAASQSDSGDVLAHLGSNGVDVAGGESLAAFFDPAEAPSGTERTWVFELSGWRTGTGASAQVSHIQQEPLHEPVVFGLGQNHPNPFSRSTQIRMGIPSRSPVRLEVFDLFGRRVRLLADRAFEPGYYSLDWDGRTDGGVRAAAGVYMYRLSAAGRQMAKRVILLP